MNGTLRPKVICILLTLGALLSINSAGGECAPLPPDLVSWWQAENNGLDSAGTNDGVLEDGIAFASGMVNQSFAFESEGSLRIPASSTLDVGTGPGFSIEGWINLSHVTNKHSIAEWNNGSGWGVHFHLDPISFNAGPGTLYANIVDSDGGWHQIRSPANTITNDSFQHVALTYDKASGIARIYRDGAIVAEQHFGSFTPLTSFDLYLGKRPSSGIIGYSGLLDEVSLYGRALTSNEIADIYEAGNAGKCRNDQSTCVEPPSGLVAWWPAEGAPVEIVSNNHASLSDGATFAGGFVGQAFLFENANSSASAPASASLNVGTNDGVTLEAWILPTAVHSPNQWILGWKNPGGTYYGVNLKLSQTGPVGCLMGNIKDKFNQNHVFFSGAVLTSNEFQHVALTYDRASGVGRLFRNGLVVAEQNLGSFVAETDLPFFLGERASSHPLEAGFSGAMDEVSVYSRALSTNEIAAIYQASNAGKCLVEEPPTPVEAPADLISWWRAENNGLDSAGTNDGVLEDGIAFASGMVNKAFTFESDGSLHVPASSSLDVGTGPGFSIEGWINLSHVTNKHSIAEWNNGSGWGVHFHLDPISFNAGPGTLYANIVDSGGGWHQIRSAANTITNDSFQHVALTYDKASGIARLYRDGDIVAEQHVGSFTPLTSFDLYLGKRPSSGIIGYSGLLDEVSLYGRALTSNEIASIYNAGTAGKCPVAETPVCVEAPEGLISWWRAEADSLDSAGSNDGTLIGAAGYAPGKVGLGFALDGDHSYIRVPHHPSLNLSNEMTVEFWYKSEDEGYYGLFNKRNDDFGPLNYGIDVDVGNAIVAYFNDPNVADSDDSGWFEISRYSSSPTSGTFHHLAMTLEQVVANSVEMKTFVNGQLVKTRVFNANLGAAAGSTAPITIGASEEKDLYFLKGIIDEISLYNRALTAEEIASIYNAGSAGKCPAEETPVCVEAPEGLISWFRAENNGLDSAGSNDGILLDDGTGYSTGEVGQGFSLGGVASGVRVPASASLNVGLADGFTVESWINPSTLLRRGEIIEWNNGNTNLVDPYGVHMTILSPGELGLGAGNLFADVHGSDGQTHWITAPGGTVASNVYQHVALTYSKTSGVARLFRNGVVVAQRYMGQFTPLTSSDFYIGRRPAGIGSVHSFSGLIDEVSIYNRALETNEISAIYNAGSLGKCFVNQSPIAVADAFTTPLNTPASFSSDKLLLNDMDPDGDVLTVISTSTNSTHGGIVSLSSGAVTYTPPAAFSGTDVFSYTVSDGRGGSATGDAFVTVGNGGPVRLNIVFGPMMIGDNFVVNFAGIPGLTYTIESAPALNGPWTKVSNMTAPVVNIGQGVGIIQVIEPVGTNTTQFYRTVYPAY